MKKIVSLVLLVAMLMSAGNCAVFAESSSTYTADELAYTAYHAINAAYNSSIYYLNILGGLWESLLDKSTWDDVDVVWFVHYITANGDFDAAMPRLMLISTIAEEKLGIEDISNNKKAIVDAIKEEAASRHLTDPKAAIFILLDWGKEVNYFRDVESIAEDLEIGMEAIRMIMSNDSNYANLDTLKDFYKEASAIYNYMVDFSDDYISFTSKMKQYQADFDSWGVEFDFIFGDLYEAYEKYSDAESRFVEEHKTQAQ